MKSLSKYYIFSGLALLGAMQSCKRSFLEPKPLSIYTPDETFQSAAALWATVVSCERNARIEFMGDGAPIVTELIYSDIAVSGSTDKPGPAIDLNQAITPDGELNNLEYENRIEWYWLEQFRAIRYANTTIHYIDVPQDYTDEAEKNHLLGAAYFHRALRYYRLVHQFGDVPAVFFMATEPKLDFYSTKREVILEQLKTDLEFAQEWVPDNVNKGQVTKGAVGHLLTKVNLALGYFDDAIESANKVINGGTYSLMTSRFGSTQSDANRNVIWDLHRPQNKSLANNREALFLVIDRINLDGNQDGGVQSMRNGMPFWSNAGIVTPAGNRAMSDQPNVEFPMVMQYGRGIGRIRPTWHSQHGLWTDSTDLRHAPGNWMRMEDLVYNAPTLKGSDPNYGKPLQMRNAQGGLLTTDTIRFWFDWPHYKLFVEDPQRVQPAGGNSDWYVFRLAETLLLRAEAYVWKGDFASAASDINTVRARANATPMAVSEVNIGTVLDERARELYYEEPRKTELTRIAYIYAKTGIASDEGKTYSVANFSESNYFYDRVMAKSDFYNKGVKTNFGIEYRMSPYHVLWPIPISAINGNPKGNINQNIGYLGSETNVEALDYVIDKADGEE